MSNTFNPYQPPASFADQDSVPAPGQPTKLATRSDRLGASMIDGFIALVVIVPLQFAFHVYDGFPNVRLSIVEQLVWGVAGFVFFLLVHGYFLLKSSQTVGKKLLGLQIVNFVDGAPTPGSKIVLARVLPVTVLAQIPKIGMVFSLIDILSIFGRERRCAHDYIAGTKVVKLSPFTR